MNEPIKIQVKKDYWRNAEILKSMQKQLPLHEQGPEGKSGKHRINVEILLLNDLKVRREVEYIWIDDPYSGFVVHATVLGNRFPCAPYELERDISHHIEELHLVKINDLEIN